MWPTRSIYENLIDDADPSNLNFGKTIFRAYGNKTSTISCN